MLGKLLKTSLKIVSFLLLFALCCSLVIIGAGSPILGFLVGGLFAFATYKIGNKVFDYITKDSNPQEDITNSRGQKSLNQLIGLDFNNLNDEDKSVPMMQITDNSKGDLGKFEDGKTKPALFTDLRDFKKNQQTADKHK